MKLHVSVAVEDLEIVLEHSTAGWPPNEEVVAARKRTREAIANLQPDPEEYLARD
jgi:hypothetical protein